MASPLKQYLQTTDSVVTQQDAIITATVAVHQQVVAAVSGKRIRVLGMILSSVGAGISGVSFTDGSGGTLKLSTTAPSNATVAPQVHFPFEEAGYFETTAGTGLFVDVGTTGCYVFVQYVAYTPG